MKPVSGKYYWVSCADYTGPVIYIGPNSYMEAYEFRKPGIDKDVIYCIYNLKCLRKEIDYETYLYESIRLLKAKLAQLDEQVMDIMASRMFSKAEIKKRKAYFETKSRS